jgi:aryl-alcohol dehydrogenase
MNATAAVTPGKSEPGVFGPIVEGDGVPDLFLPKLVKRWEQGRFPVDRLMTFYEFDDIERAAHDAESGRTIKAVLRMAA